MEGNVQHMVKQVLNFDGKNADNFLEWYFKLRVNLSLYSKTIVEIVQRPQRPTDSNNESFNDWGGARMSQFCPCFGRERHANSSSWEPI